MILEAGRICLKTAGREAGKYCVVVEHVNDAFVLVTGPKSVTGVKRRKCNIFHLQPTPEKFNIEPKSDDSKIEQMWMSSDLVKKLGVTVPEKRTKKKETKTPVHH